MDTLTPTITHTLAAASQALTALLHQLATHPHSPRAVPSIDTVASNYRDAHHRLATALPDAPTPNPYLYTTPNSHIGRTIDWDIAITVDAIGYTIREVAVPLVALHTITHQMRASALTTTAPRYAATLLTTLEALQPLSAWASHDGTAATFTHLHHDLADALSPHITDEPLLPSVRR